jgi:hypothetical protein
MPPPPLVAEELAPPAELPEEDATLPVELEGSVSPQAAMKSRSAIAGGAKARPKDR